MWRKLFIPVVLLVIVSGMFARDMAQAQERRSWYAQFYNNRYLLDPVVADRFDTSINFDWGGGSPAPGVNADDFSVRWTRTYTVGSGIYQITAQASGGLRVLINNVPYVNDPGSGRSHNVNFQLMAGEYVIEVEYWDTGGNASVNMTFGAVIPPTAAPTATTLPGVTPTFSPATLLPTPNLSGTTLVVRTGELNVRSAPSTNSRIITTVLRFEIYPVIGRTPDSEWYQITVNNLRVIGVVVGWVSADWVRLSNSANIPVTFNVTAGPTGYFIETTAFVEFRTGPSDYTPTQGVLIPGTRLEIYGISADGNWWYVSLDDDFYGWVHSDYTQLLQDVDYGIIPVFDN